MAYQYKRLRPSIIRNLWVYRRLVGSAILLGLMLWFIWANDTPVTVAFPFRLGLLNSTLGVVILLSAIVGSLTTVLIMTVVRTARKIRGPQSSPVSQNPNELANDLPPPDYAAKTTEGFPGAPWSH
ncbi:MAG TPA: DUF1049 domain-containing protein [Candidatus Methylomirabilis sp.]|nr:DUF1049 domain-containing protein [Candidatus Methylomirabilis sp.]